MCCESFISFLYTFDFCPRVKYLEHYIANMVPLNFVQDIFTSWRFMAERIKVIMKVAEKIQRGRGLKCVGEKEGKRDE